MGIPQPLMSTISGFAGGCKSTVPDACGIPDTVSGFVPLAVPVLQCVMVRRGMLPPKRAGFGHEPASLVQLDPNVA